MNKKNRFRKNFYKTVSLLIILIVFTLYIMSLAFTEYMWLEMDGESFIVTSTEPINWALPKAKMQTTLIWLLLPLWTIYISIAFFFFRERWDVRY